MKILIITESYGAKYYGVGAMLEQQVRHMLNSGVNIKVAAMRYEGGDKNNIDIVKLPIFRIGRSETTLGRLMRFHPEMYSVVRSQIRDFQPDIVHIHGVFTFVQLVSVRAAKKQGKKIVLSTHGMLESWLWKQKGALYYMTKKAYWLILVRPVLKGVSCFHAITENEKKTLAKLLPATRVLVIPNAIEMEGLSSKQLDPDRPGYFLFLGRIHPVKNIDSLLRGFSEIRDKGYKLVIAGPVFDKAYYSGLHKIVRELGLDDKVKFVGVVGGREKDILIARAWVTVMPSHTEVMGMVNLESSGRYTPTITTYNSGLESWDIGGGLLVNNSDKSLASALNQAAEWSIEERMQRGRLSRLHVERHYSQEIVGNMWLDAYSDISASPIFSKKH